MNPHTLALLTAMTYLGLVSMWRLTMIVKKLLIFNGKKMLLSVGLNI